MTPTFTPTKSTPSSYPSVSPSTLYVITTIAGSSTSGSYSGDSGQATAATLNGPYGVTLDATGSHQSYMSPTYVTSLIPIPFLGNVYICDASNHRVRKVTVSTGIITTFAGSGSTGSTSGSYSGDNGPATAATLYGPKDTAVDSAGTSVAISVVTLLILTSSPT